MHALLGRVQAVGVLALGAERRRLDAGLLPRARLQQLDLEAAPLGPAHHHAQHHLRPVLGVGPAGAGVDGHERVAGVVVAGEQPLLLERGQALLDRDERLLELGRELGVLLGQLDEAVEVGRVGVERSNVSSRRCTRAYSALTFAAASGSSQKPPSPICASSAAARSLRPAGSKIVREQGHLLADGGEALRRGEGLRARHDYASGQLTARFSGLGPCT